MFSKKLIIVSDLEAYQIIDRISHNLRVSLALEGNAENDTFKISYKLKKETSPFPAFVEGKLENTRKGTELKLEFGLRSDVKFGLYAICLINFLVFLVLRFFESTLYVVNGINLDFVLVVIPLIAFLVVKLSFFNQYEMLKNKVISLADGSLK